MVHVLPWLWFVGKKNSRKEAYVMSSVLKRVVTHSTVDMWVVLVVALGSFRFTPGHTVSRAQTPVSRPSLCHTDPYPGWERWWEYAGGQEMACGSWTFYDRYGRCWECHEDAYGRCWKYDRHGRCWECYEDRYGYRWTYDRCGRCWKYDRCGRCWKYDRFGRCVQYHDGCGRFWKYDRYGRCKPAVPGVT